MNIKYTKDINSITEDMLTGFFVNWPNPPNMFVRNHKAVESTTMIHLILFVLHSNELKEI